MSDISNKSYLVPIYEIKCDVHECGNYRDINLMSHTIKLWGKIINKRLR